MRETWSANKIAVLSVGVGVCLSVIGVTLVRLFGHDEPTFLAQIALAGISGLVGFATGQAVDKLQARGPAEPAAEAGPEPDSEPEPGKPQFPPPTAPLPPPPAPAPPKTGGPDTARYIAGVTSQPPTPQTPPPTPGIDQIIAHHFQP